VQIAPENSKDLMSQPANAQVTIDNRSVGTVQNSEKPNAKEFMSQLARAHVDNRSVRAVQNMEKPNAKELMSQTSYVLVPVAQAIQNLEKPDAKELMSQTSNALLTNNLSAEAGQNLEKPNITLSDALPAGLDADNEVAEKELSRNITKKDFGLMNVVGQFNLGFIIARLDKHGTSDLFIIDQHASDEKYNFETLQLQSRIECQCLIRLVKSVKICNGTLDHADIASIWD
jgi:DNA mismatch repair ATPase MutL